MAQGLDALAEVGLLGMATSQEINTIHARRNCITKEGRKLTAREFILERPRACSAHHSRQIRHLRWVAGPTRVFAGPSGGLTAYDPANNPPPTAKTELLDK